MALAVSFGLAYLLDYSVGLRLLEEGSPLSLPVLLARMLTPAIGAAVGLAVEGSLRSWRTVIPARWPGLSALLASALAATLPFILAPLLGVLLGLPPGPCGLLRVAGSLWPIMALTLYAAGIMAGTTVNMVAALGEEAGWRGMLHTALRPRLGPVLSGLLIGLVWGLWHAPLVWNGYNYVLPGDLACPGEPARGLSAVLAFMLFTASTGLILTGLRERYGSVLAPAAGHGAMNAVAGLSAMLAGGPRLVAPPAGLLVSVAAGLVALLVWRGVPLSCGDGARGGS